MKTQLQVRSINIVRNATTAEDPTTRASTLLLGRVIEQPGPGMAYPEVTTPVSATEDEALAFEVGDVVEVTIEKVVPVA